MKMLINVSGSFAHGILCDNTCYEGTPLLAQRDVSQSTNHRLMRNVPIIVDISQINEH
jgi:hypothetical protein